jgi:ABC-type nickel/cobalt efflux system permease component RcnA
VPRAFLIAGAVLGAVLLAGWLAGGGAAVEALARDAARSVQEALARALRALRMGEPGALAGLLAIAFAYGIAHAAGPGHGKVLIGSYALARRTRLLPMAGMALAASLAQATVAVGLVIGGAAVFELTRLELARIAEVALPPFGHAAIALLGLWLAVRGGRGLWRAARGPAAPAAGRRHGAPGAAADCGCGHRHGPSAAEVAAVASWRDAALLIGGVALRPCTGAVFLLVLTWQADILPAGIAGAYAMGLGTATVTVATAALAVWAREGAFASLPGGAARRAAVPLVETMVGAAIAVAGLYFLAGSV